MTYTMLQSKPILAPKEEDDGIRISIMSRHTEEDGKTPDKRITPDKFDIHMPQFAARPKMVGAYYRKELNFEEYGKQYVEYLKTQQKELIELLYQAETTNVTVMCIEDTPEKCHRRLFMEYSQELAKVLHIELETKIG